MPQTPHPPPPGYQPLSGLLALVGRDFQGLTYIRLWHIVVSGHLPMVLRHRNRWYFHRRDVKAIASVLTTVRLLETPPMPPGKARHKPKQAAQEP